jgi:replicative DNA helicase
MLHDKSLELCALWHIHMGDKAVTRQLEPEDFSDPVLRIVFKAIYGKQEFNAVEVQNEIEDQIKEHKPYVWLEWIVESPYLGAPYQIVSALKKLRARREAKEFKSRANDEEIPFEFIDKGKEIGDMMRYKKSAVDEIIHEVQRVPDTHPTGFSSIDYLLNGGFEEGSMNVIAARPGVGKTALATHLSSLAIESGIDVCFVSLEMSRKSVIERVMQSFWNKDVSSVRKNISDMIQLPADFICENPNYSIDRVIGALTANLDAKVFIVDYYQLIQVPKSNESHVQQLEYVSNMLKQFAFENNKILIVLAQLNRQIEQDRRNREPELSDLRGCGALEQDAHVVSFLWDKNQKDRLSETKKGVDDAKNFYGGVTTEASTEADLQWIIKKNRTGQLGSVPLEFNYNTMTFKQK